MPPPPLRPGVATALAAFATLSLVVGVTQYLEIPSLLASRKRSRKVESRNFSKEDLSLSAFKTLAEQLTLPSTYPLASDVQKNIPIYDCAALKVGDREAMNDLQDEWNHILIHGPGVFVLKNFFTDRASIDAANVALESVAQREAESSYGGGDHFATADTNTRVWNSLLKHGLEDPSSFYAYYSNPLFPLVCEAYLGPAYRLTAQLNIVRPGGAAQSSHRDYHLGFQADETVLRIPKAQQEATKLLTLQGAVAHTDMPLESGPTRFLPFTQMMPEGYLAYRRPEYQAYFEENYVSLPLEKGDAVFFSPALFHAAGENKTESFSRSANLIQVSAAWGKTMETMDSLVLIEACWEFAWETHKKEGMSRELEAFVKAVAEGYPFPTNLDRRPPAPSGMAPESEQDVLLKALSEEWSKERVMEELTAMQRASAAR